MQEKKVHQAHQTPGTVFFDRVLVFDREKFPARPVLIDSKHDLGYSVTGFVENIEHHLFGPRPSLLQLDAEITAGVNALAGPVLPPHTKPTFKHTRRTSTALRCCVSVDFPPIEVVV